MATIFVEAFTNTNGTAWSTHNADWDVYTAASGSAATVESNAGRQRMTAGSYSASVFCFHRDSAHTDIRVFGTLVADADDSEMYPQVRIRQTDEDDGTQSHTCYVLDLQTPWDSINLTKRVAGEDDTLDSASFSFAGGTTYYWVFEAVGSSIRAWIDTGTWADPDVDSPDLSATDSDIDSGGFSLEVFGGDAATTMDAIWDALDADDLEPDPEPPEGALVPIVMHHRRLIGVS